MGNLLASILNSANAMSVYNRQLSVIQNNISNANTPGYVKQTQELEAMHLDLSQGLVGGVAAGPVVSSRSEFAEEGVRNQLSQLGEAEQKAGDLAQIAPVFDLKDGTGIAGAFNDFFNSFSQLSLNPNDSLARQSVLNAGQQVSDTFNETAAGMARAAQQSENQVQNITDTINHIASAIKEVNSSYKKSFQSLSDAGLDASLHSNLEQLSELVDFTTTRASDGTVSVYIGGQTPLVIGDKQFAISADLSSRTSSAILDSEQRDVTSQIHSGQLSGVLEERNDLIPSYIDDLNTLGQQFTTAVNQQLASGVDKNGLLPSTDMFAYDAAVGAASMRLNPLTTDQIAAATISAPGGNANALNVSELRSSKTMGGYTFTEFFGNLSGRIGRDISSAQTDKTTRSGLVDQARSMREEISGVSLDEEAAHLLQVQRAYQASGKLMSVLNDMMDTLMNAFR